MIERLFEETQGGKYEPSEHHPQCEKYKTERYHRFSIKGLGGFTDKLENIFEFLKEEFENSDEQSLDIHFEVVDITKDQYENLPDFMGF